MKDKAKQRADFIDKIMRAVHRAGELQDMLEWQYLAIEKMNEQLEVMKLEETE